MAPALLGAIAVCTAAEVLAAPLLVADDEAGAVDGACGATSVPMWTANSADMGFEACVQQASRCVII